MSGESKGENLCRRVLEKFYERQFPKVRPDFLLNPETGQNLELDGYNSELKIAFEYNGIQHYEYPNTFHKTEKEFIDQVRRDMFKKEICNQLGIHLISIPHHIHYGKIKDYIEYYLPENIEIREGLDEPDTSGLDNPEVSGLPEKNLVIDFSLI